MKNSVMKIIGVISIFLSIYFYLSFENMNFFINPLRESCNHFGDASEFICQYFGAINWFIVSIFGGVGYALLTHKAKQVQQPSV